jgi:hypothetical protein
VLEVHVLPDPAALADELRGRGNAHKRERGSAVARLIDERMRDDGGGR